MKENFLRLKIVISNIYPASVRELAEKLDVPAETIARQKGIKPGEVVDEYIRRDIIEMIDRITQNPDNRQQTILSYVDGSFDVIDEAPNDVVKKIGKFLGDQVVFHHRNLYSYDESSDEEED